MHPASRYALTRQAKTKTHRYITIATFVLAACFNSPPLANLSSGTQCQDG